MMLKCASKSLDLTIPRVMGVLNLTPDSFSDGGRFLRSGKIDLSVVEDSAQQMVEAGAAILDLGGESTRPNAAVVSPDEELNRVMPVLERLLGLDVILSVDTSKALVAAQAIQAGAHMVNDVRALTEPGMLECIAGSNVAVCLMHMQGAPDTMQQAPHYKDVCAEICQYLSRQIDRVVAVNVDRDRIVVDPGFGFGKTVAHNYALLRGLSGLETLGLPVLVGLSRKSMLGKVVDRPPQGLMAAGVAATVLACERGASIIRTHDVAAAVDAIKICLADRQMEN